MTSSGASNATMTLPTIAITTGEPAGIGPDISLMIAMESIKARLVFIGDKSLLASRAQALDLEIVLSDAEEIPPHQAGHMTVLHTPLNSAVEVGVLNANNAEYVLSTLQLATQHCQDQTFDAMVTAPVHKGVINDAGIAFSGHTEFLAEITQAEKVVMMLASEAMRVALVTTHLPLRAVPEAITTEHLKRTIEILHHDLIHKFGIAQPKIIVAGLNPHAGENGHLGDEEIQIITPVLNHLRNQGMQLIGPLPADTMFTQQHLAQADAALAMYHDQGLPVLKHASFGEAINVTLGLPMIRTSVDHGTALSLAGTGNVNTGSLMAAINAAISLATV